MPVLWAHCCAGQALLGSHPDNPTSEMVFLPSRVKAPGRESLHNYIKVPEPVVFLCALPPNKRDSAQLLPMWEYTPQVNPNILGLTVHLRIVGSHVTFQSDPRSYLDGLYPLQRTFMKNKWCYDSERCPVLGIFSLLRIKSFQPQFHPRRYNFVLKGFSEGNSIKTI